MIRCKINDTVYIGQTGERNGLSGRWKRHKQRMNSGNGNNSFLQADWDLYGVDQFEFIVLESGIQWNDEKIRKKRETELIRDFREKGLNLYNVYESDDQKRYPSCLLSSKESCLQNQTQEFRNFISQLNTGRPNANRIAVVINNQVFLSISEAAAYLNISTKTIRLRIQSNVENFSYASPEQVNEEILARERAGIVKLEPPQNFSVQKRTSGLSKKVKIHGKVYESISEAAKALNLSPQAISKSLKKGRPGYNYLDN
uniref:Putative GIY-YIG endonuclease n=1 Tax=Hariotina sp. MMOGRB0030F TaxID=1867922 RepID=A0A2H4FMB5_9CHLO|nr:putative GIY-YIG endonuclease [Hariotina sp. MMOGRB0030F]